jgi:ribosome maturation factor RimP
VREPHFQRAVGQRVRVRTRTPIGGRRQFHGTLETVAAGAATVCDADAGTVVIPLADIEKANTEYDFSRPTGRPHASA